MSSKKDISQFKYFSLFGSSSLQIIRKGQQHRTIFCLMFSYFAFIFFFRDDTV